MTRHPLELRKATPRLRDAMPQIIDAAYRYWLAIDGALPIDGLIAIGVRQLRSRLESPQSR
jgi:hypothetical protein